MGSHHPWWVSRRTVVCVDPICGDWTSTRRVVGTYALWCVQRVSVCVFRKSELNAVGHARASSRATGATARE